VTPAGEKIVSFKRGLLTTFLKNLHGVTPAGAVLISRPGVPPRATSA